MTYKWTIADVDDLTLPFIQVLLKEIQEMPPYDLIANMQHKAMVEEMKKTQLVSLSSFEKKKGTVKRRPKDGD